MDLTEVLLALETAVLERNEHKIFPMNDTFRLTHTDLGERNLESCKDDWRELK